MDEQRLAGIEGAAEHAYNEESEDSLFEVMLADIRALIAEVRALRKGEFICDRCGIRKDSEATEDLKDHTAF